MRHLNDSEFVDLVEGRLTGERGRHAEACDACRAQAGELRAVLSLTQAEAAPEPSPLFWEHFSARVSGAVAAEGRPQSSWGLWLREGGIQWAAAVAVVLLVAGLAWRTLIGTDPTGVDVADTEFAAAADEPYAAGAAADAWDAIVTATDDLELEETELLGIRVRPGSAERMAEELTVDEQRELARLIEEEIKRTGA